MKFLTDLIFAAMASIAISASAAQGPTFNCAKAQGEVETLICRDDALATLDRNLDAAYKAATAKAIGTLASQLRAEQRGWVKGRNECWKANGHQTWITATWTVNTVRACVEAQYRLRTSELQAVWRLVVPRTVAYGCQNNPSNELVVHHFDTDPPTIRLERADRTVTLWQVGNPAADQFEGPNVSLVRKDNTLAMSWLQTDTGTTDELSCTAK